MLDTKRTTYAKLNRESIDPLKENPREDAPKDG